MTEKIKYENWDFENPAEFTADFIENGFKALSRSGTTDEQVCIIALDMLDRATLDRLKSDQRFHIKVNIEPLDVGLYNTFSFGDNGVFIAKGLDYIGITDEPMPTYIYPVFFTTKSIVQAGSPSEVRTAQLERPNEFITGYATRVRKNADIRL